MFFNIKSCHNSGKSDDLTMLITNVKITIRAKIARMVMCWGLFYGLFCPEIGDACAWKGGTESEITFF